LSRRFLFSFALLSVLLLLPLSSCSGGGELARIDGTAGEYILYGTPYAVDRIVLTDSESGKTLCEIDLDYYLDQPWMGQDNSDFGVTVAFINDDEFEDIAVMYDRTPSAERYYFYFSNAQGEYKLQHQLSDLTAPTFGETKGVITSSVNQRFDTPTVPAEPPIYEIRSEKFYYKWNEKGRLVLDRCIRFSYFSDTDIYLYATLLPDQDSDEGMSAVDEIWIYPDRLDEWGLEPLK
jgi:hypothetical protein